MSAALLYYVPIRGNFVLRYTCGPICGHFQFQHETRRLSSCGCLPQREYELVGLT